MKLTKSKLMQLINEAIGDEGIDMGVEDKPLDFAALSGPDYPMVVNSYIKSMARALYARRTVKDMATLWDEMLEEPGNVGNAQSWATKLGLETALAGFHARRIQDGVNYPTGTQMWDAIEGIDWPARPSGEP
jgi:hypothetical protein